MITETTGTLAFVIDHGEIRTAYTPREVTIEDMRGYYLSTFVVIPCELYEGDFDTIYTDIRFWELHFSHYEEWARENGTELSEMSDIEVADDFYMYLKFNTDVPAQLL